MTGRQQIANRSIFTGDNVEIMRGINSASVDLIYADPPFNKNKNFSAPIGSKAAGAHFKDRWTWDEVKDEWLGEISEQHPKLGTLIHAYGEIRGKDGKAYLLYMAVRIIQMHRILKPEGSLCLHCDPTMGCEIKGLLDAVFGAGRLINQFIWHYKNASRGKKQFAKSHDTIYWYGKGEEWTFNRENVLAPFESGMTEWRYTRGGQKGRAIPKGKTPDDVFALPSLNAMAKERTGYPTQKPLQLLQYLVRAASNAGDVVLDPFCGCATTLIAAEIEGRRWIGIDISPKAMELVMQRMKKEVMVGDRRSLEKLQIHHMQTFPIRTDGAQKRSKDIRHILYGRQEGFCRGCDGHFQIRHMHLDHRTPKSKGGADVDANLQLMCSHCNLLKGAGTMAELKAKLRAGKYI